MNPISGLNNAMNRERKPFTYTPGGLDLSEIKSERMAKRLMRNAMNQGVSETPAHLIKSPPASGIPIAIPNFNCLPVQVFPAFQLPANPKSLLRTRSNPGASRDSSHRPIDVSQQQNDNPKNIVNVPVSNNFTNSTNNNTKSNLDNLSNVATNNFHTLPKINNGNITNENLLSTQLKCDPYDYDSKNKIPVHNPTPIRSVNNGIGLDFPVNTNNNILREKCIEENVGYTNKTENTTEHENKQEEVNVIETEIKEDPNIECHNGDTETAVVVKLPTKKSAAKTETKVEVVQNILPDGTVQEVKTTTTKTTKDGKTEIATKTETRAISKEETDEEEYEEEEEEYEEEEEIDRKVEQTQESSVNTTIESNNKEANEIDKDSNNNVESETEDTSEYKNIKQNGRIVMQEEKIETSTTKKVVVQSEIQESDEEIEELEEETDDQADVEEVVIIKKQNELKSDTIKADNQTNIENTIEVESDKHSDAESEPEEEIMKENKKDNDSEIENTINHDSEVKSDKVDENENPKDEVCDEEMNESNVNDADINKENKTEEEKQNNDDNSKIITEPENVVENDDQEAEDFEEIEDEEKRTDKKIISNNLEEAEIKSDKNVSEENKAIIKTEENIIPVQVESNSKTIENKYENDEKPQCRTDIKDAFSEPSIPLEKVEEVDIKPICVPAQEIITKSHKEIITTTTDKPSGALSTQTEYNVVENIVTVNRTTKTLDHAYEQAGEYIIPVVKTSLVPDNSSYLPISQPPTRPYETTYSKKPETERRHSLLLERLSVERQPPPSMHYSDSTYNRHLYEGNQFSSEPQSEVLTESNVKPSMINKNQQWYAKKDSYDNTTTDTTPSHQWIPTQIQKPTQNQYQNNIHTSQDYSQSNIHTTQNYSESNIQTTQDYSQNFIQKPQEQPQYIINTPHEHYNHTINHQTFSQRQQTPQPQAQSAFTETITEDTYKSSTDNYNRNSYPSYTPKPSWVSSTVDPKPTLHSQPNKYSFLNTESDIYQKSTQNQNSYVPPPWEQDTGYSIDSVNQNTYYQPQQNLTTQISIPTATWKPTVKKQPKTTPTSYIPPAPNQSFVKPVSALDQPNVAGRKTYYSEYERRYITVPESTYIPTETKFQAQPDPSPKYYYDQQEILEPVEPQWRKELREFTEKTQTSTQTIETSVRPPWEQVSKYIPSETPNAPNWSQTLRPGTCQEQSVESEYTATTKEWQKTNTLGRGRPQSSYLKNNLERIPERARGVSVDRYNPNSYQPPLSAEHPPVQSQTLDPAIHPKPHYRPNVSAYPSRASAEPREQPVHNQAPRVWVDSRTPPVQSRSFKYLQWITGTED